VGPGGICGAAGVGGSEGGGGVGVVVEPLGRGRAHGCGLVPREFRVREEAPRGRLGRIPRRRRVCGGAEGQEALPALGGGLRFVLAAVHVGSGRIRIRNAPSLSVAEVAWSAVRCCCCGRRREFALGKEHEVEEGSLEDRDGLMMADSSPNTRLGSPLAPCVQH